MFAASLLVLALAYFNPPQIFWIMYLGGTVIASSWSVVAFASIWSKKISRTGAYWGMLCGFLGCAAAKAYSALSGQTLPIYLDPFFIGLALSIVGTIIGSKIKKPDAAEAAARERLFQEPECEKDEAEVKKTHRLWYVYAAFGVFVGLFFLFMYALPYTRAMG
jgi:sodium/pantothenate symporter